MMNIFNPWLFVPVNNIKFIEKSSSVCPYRIVLDLEDSIFKEQKDEARNCLLNMSMPLPIEKVAVRVNSLNTKWGLEDLNAVSQRGIGTIIYPKIADSKEISEVEKILRKFHYQVELIPIIETKKGIENAEEIISGLSLSNLIVFGSEDYLADISIFERRFTWNNPYLFNALNRLINISKRFDKFVIDSANPCLEKQKRSFQIECELALTLGVVGKLAIHPYQVEIINKIYQNLNNNSYYSNKEIENILDNMINEKQTAIRYKNHLIGIPEIRKFKLRIESNNNFFSQSGLEKILSKIKMILPEYD